MGDLIFKLLVIVGIAVLFGCCIPDVSYGQSRVSLKDAVEEFNRNAKADRVGKFQDPLTVEEVIAAIRLARGDFARHTLPDAAKKEYLEIESKMSIDELDEIDSTNGWGPLEIGEDFYAFDVWWIDLRLKRHSIKDKFGRVPSHFNVRIREKTVSSRKLTKEEADKRRKYLEKMRFEMERQRMEFHRKQATDK